MEVPSSLLAELVEKRTSRFCETSVRPSNPAFSAYSARLESCLDCWSEKYARCGVNHMDDVISHLESRVSPKGQEFDSDPSEDVILAMACLDGEQPATNEFLNRYSIRVENEIQRRCPLVHNRDFASHVPDVWTLFVKPRQRSGPRLESFRGDSALWPFVWMSVFNLYRSWRRHEERHLPSIAPEDGGIEPTSSWADAELPQSVREAMAAMFKLMVKVLEKLPRIEQLVFWWVIVEGRTQIGLGRITGQNRDQMHRLVAKVRKALTKWRKQMLEEMNQADNGLALHLLDLVQTNPAVLEILWESASDWFREMQTAAQSLEDPE